MKKQILLTLMAAFFLMTFQVEAQKKQKSPPVKVEKKVGDANLVINYFSPSARERKIMGGLVPYGKVWRTGANNATVFEVDKDIKVEGQTLPKGKYALFTIPGENEWTIIFNKKHDQWGAFNYNQEDDALRVKVKPEKTSEHIESFKIDVDDKDNVFLGWENTLVRFKIKN
ncbi:MAG: DUF2911 domain-containing protein [Candidatus Cyclobacteriaceae bacterium M2_1C_046]